MAKTNKIPNSITLSNFMTGDEKTVEHRRAITLAGGFYIVQRFKRVGRSIKSIQKELDAGRTVYYLNSYCGNCDPPSDLVFTGKVVWKNEKFYEISSGMAGGGLRLGRVPQGTLIIGISDD
jgi:hypothetical protein